MKDFESYYNDRFRRHLEQFFETIPDSSKHHDKYDHSTYYIQYERLTKDLSHTDFIKEKTEKINFGIALFLTVLVDEVCYSHFNPYYQEFKPLTNYPKFIGNCPGGCNFHFHPTDIFSAMNYLRDNRAENTAGERLDFRDAFIEAIPIMEKEVKSFFQQQLVIIDGNDFWQKCYSELPYKSKNDRL